MTEITNEHDDSYTHNLKKLRALKEKKALFDEFDGVPMQKVGQTQKFMR